jgi:hypothetical protein
VLLGPDNTFSQAVAPAERPAYRDYQNKNAAFKTASGERPFTGILRIYGRVENTTLKKI